MNMHLSPLGAAFVDDHKRLTQGFHRLAAAIHRRDPAELRALAAQIDAASGAHIRFEETVLYPIVRKERGRDYAQKLYGEHRIAASVLRDVLSHPEETPWTDDEWKSLESRVQTALDHAISCGTLLSHLTTLSKERQEDIHGRLVDLRQDSPHWTGLPPADDDE